MATYTFTPVFDNALSTTANTQLYQVPANSTLDLKEIVVGNDTSSAITVNIIVGNTYYFPAILVAANDTKVLSGLNSAVSAGATIQGWASAAGTTCKISGVVMS